MGSERRRRRRRFCVRASALRPFGGLEFAERFAARGGGSLASRPCATPSPSVAVAAGGAAELRDAGGEVTAEARGAEAAAPNVECMPGSSPPALGSCWPSRSTVPMLGLLRLRCSTAFATGPVKKREVDNSSAACPHFGGLGGAPVAQPPRRKAFGAGSSWPSFSAARRLSESPGGTRSDSLSPGFCRAVAAEGGLRRFEDLIRLEDEDDEELLPGEASERLPGAKMSGSSNSLPMPMSSAVPRGGDCTGGSSGAVAAATAAAADAAAASCWLLRLLLLVVAGCAAWPSEAAAITRFGGGVAGGDFLAVAGDRCSSCVRGDRGDLEREHDRRAGGGPSGTSTSPAA